MDVVTPQLPPGYDDEFRHRYLYCGSDAGGERAAAIYSLIGTAKLNGMDPEAYLRYVIERIADHPPRGNSTGPGGGIRWKRLYRTRPSTQRC